MYKSGFGWDIEMRIAVSYINAVKLNILSSLEINEKPDTGYASETNSLNEW